MPTADPTRMQPIRALRALARLLRDPNDTEQVFEVLAALGGRALRNKARQLRRSDIGRALLDERPSLLATLAAAGPETYAAGTLGHAYQAFVTREQITTDGLVAISDASKRNLDDDALYLSERVTQAHDLWHVVAGYEGDIVGEACLLAFTHPHTRNPGIALMAGALYIVAGGRLGIRGLMGAAYDRGKRSADLITVRWEDLLHRPLEEVRQHLAVDDPPVYRQVRAADLGPKGLFGPLPGAA